MLELRFQSNAVPTFKPSSILSIYYIELNILFI
uniref:Uncharacterized protein n=1 Tax=Heterorhabditis bacteriophora TaxID=37862 RepID=A0A1I7WCS5_HETBA